MSKIRYLIIVIGIIFFFAQNIKSCAQDTIHLIGDTHLGQFRYVSRNDTDFQKKRMRFIERKNFLIDSIANKNGRIIIFDEYHTSLEKFYNLYLERGRWCKNVEFDSTYERAWVEHIYANSIPQVAIHLIDIESKGSWRYVTGSILAMVIRDEDILFDYERDEEIYHFLDSLPQMDQFTKFLYEISEIHRNVNRGSSRKLYKLLCSNRTLIDEMSISLPDKDRELLHRLFEAYIIGYSAGRNFTRRMALRESFFLQQLSYFYEKENLSNAILIVGKSHVVDNDIIPYNLSDKMEERKWFVQKYILK
jgi:hypothetical protein